MSLSSETGTRTGEQIRDAALLACIVVLGAGLRLAELGRKSYWWDEIATVEICSAPFSEFLKWLWRFEGNMSLYYFLARYWIQFSHNEAWVRLFSVLFSVASIFVIYVVGRQLSGTRTGLFAAFLLSINAAHVAYAQEARGYSLLMLLCLLSLHFFLRIRHSGDGNALAYVIVSALAVYAHFFAVFFLFAQWTSILWLYRDRVEWKRFLLPVVLTSGLILPAILYMLFRRSGQLSFVSPTEFQDLARLIYFLAADGARYHKALALIYLVCVGAAVRTALVRGRDEISDRSWGTIVILCCAILPVAVVFLLSFFVPMFAPRYLLICLPPLVLVVAQGLAELRPSWLQFAVLALIAGLSVATLRWYYHTPKEDWRSVAKYLSQHAETADVVVVCPAGSEMAVQYYAASLATTATFSYRNVDVFAKEIDSGRSAGKPVTASRVWLITWGKNPQCARISDAMNSEYRLEDEQRFPGYLGVTLRKRLTSAPVLGK